MNRRIIINIQDDKMSDAYAISLVYMVVNEGRISESGGRKHYCHCTRFAIGGHVLATKRSDSTDTFYIQPAE